MLAVDRFEEVFTARRAKYMDALADAPQRDDGRVVMVGLRARLLRGLRGASTPRAAAGKS